MGILTISRKCAGVVLAALLASILFTGCATSGGKTEIGRLTVNGALTDFSGQGLPDQELLIVRGHGIKPSKVEMQVIKGWDPGGHHELWSEALRTGANGGFQHTFMGVVREEPFWVFPPYSALPVPPDHKVTLMLLLKTPGPDGRIYQIRGKDPMASALLYDPEIAAFRRPHPEEAARETVTASIASGERPIPGNEAYTQPIHEVLINVQRATGETNATSVVSLE